MDELSFLVGLDWGEDVLDPAINGQSLIEMVREIELSFATKESHAQIAGAYSGIPRSAALLPSHHLLGDFSYWGNESERSVLLVCTCGIPGCWALLAKIEVTQHKVVWRDFVHNHRPAWSYDTLGPFRFDKQQYIEALQIVPTAKSPSVERQEREREESRRQQEEEQRQKDQENAIARVTWQKLASRVENLQRLLPSTLHERPDARLKLVNYRLEQHHCSPDGRALYWALETFLRIGQNNECSAEFWQEMLAVGEEFMASPPTRPL